jgi:uncharacterized membrane protein YfcA
VPCTAAVVIALGVAAGTIGGIYGIGGGPLLGPIPAGRGIPMAQVAPSSVGGSTRWLRVS